MWRRAWGAQDCPLLSCVPAPRTASPGPTPCWPLMGWDWPQQGGFSAEGLCRDDVGAGSQLGGVGTGALGLRWDR